MSYSDRGAAFCALKSISYYRLSAYTYALREQSPLSEAGMRRPRSDQFIAGTSFDDVHKLYNFDRKLRRCLLHGLEPS
ncbi:Abi family protein [Arthrobacter psychrolactophilus]